MKILNKNTGKIFSFDPKKMRVRRMQKRVKSWSDRLSPLLDRVGIDYRLVMITLTYRVGVDWSAGDIRDFMIRVRGALGDNLKGYTWVAELQKRGAVHYHVELLVRKGTNIPIPDKCGWWDKGMSRIETAKSVYYVLSYTGKYHQKFGEFPKGLRMFAVWIGEGVISDASRWLFRLSTVPKWLAGEIWKDGKFVGLFFPARLPGGGWVCGGDRYYSPYSVWEFE